MKYTIKLDEKEFRDFEGFKEANESIEELQNMIGRLNKEYTEQRDRYQTSLDSIEYRHNQDLNKLNEKIKESLTRLENVKNQLKEQESKLKQVNGFYKPAFWVIVVLIVLGFFVDKLGA